jgi:Sec-independent protein secretion pathway component TatC
MRILMIAGVATVVLVATFTHSTQLLEWVARAGRDALGLQRHGGTIGPSPTPNSALDGTLAIDVTVIATMPVVAYHLLRVGGARRLAAFLPAALFAGGVAVGWYVVMPRVLRYLLAAHSIDGLEAREYIQLIALTTLLSGVAFQLPAVMALRARLMVWSWGAALVIVLSSSRWPTGYTGVVWIEIVALIALGAGAWLFAARPGSAAA